MAFGWVNIAIRGDPTGNPEGGPRGEPSGNPKGEPRGNPNGEPFTIPLGECECGFALGFAPVEVFARV